MPITGDKLTHLETGAEAEYYVAVPTAGHGFLHILKSAGSYIYRLTGELESEFAPAGSVASLADLGAGVSQVESGILSRVEELLAKLEDANAPAAQVTEAKGLVSDVASLSTPVEEPQPSIGIGVTPDVSAHLPSPGGETTVVDTPSQSIPI